MVQPRSPAAITVRFPISRSHAHLALVGRDYILNGVVGAIECRFPKMNQGVGGTGDTTWQEKAVMAGRLVCDTYHSAKEFVRHKNYRLGELAKVQLGKDRPDLPMDEENNVAPYFSKTGISQHLTFSLCSLLRLSHSST
jgi:hypothetical protein